MSPFPSRTNLFLRCLVAFSCLCAVGAALLPAPDQPAEIKLGDNHALVTPVRYKNLTVWQVTAAQVEDLSNVVSLQKAQADKNVEIREAEGGGEVNKLVLENKGKQTVLVLAGTVVKGGKQDRQIGQDFVVKPGQTVDIDSFCVEHGRWTNDRTVSYARASGAGGGGAGEVPQVQERLQQQRDVVTEPVQPGQAQPQQRVHDQVADLPNQAAQPANPPAGPVQADEQRTEKAETGGKFIAQSSLADSSVRAKGQYETNQSEVWNEVAKSNTANAVHASSGTLMASKQALAENPDRKAIVALLNDKLQPPTGRHVVGLAYALNGEIINIRWFLAPKLFQDFRTAMIETIADDTLTRNAALGAEKIAAYEKSPVAYDDAKFHTFMYAERKQKAERDTPAANRNSYYETEAAHSSEAVGKEGELQGKVISSDFTAK